MSSTGNHAIVLSAVAALAVLVGFYNHTATQLAEHHRINDVLATMMQIESHEAVSEGVRVAVGYGACRDLFSSGGVVVPPPVAPTTAHHSAVQSMQQLQQLYALFFSAGSAAERYVSNKELFGSLVSAAAAAADHWWDVGGNAAVMAARLASDGAAATLLAAAPATALLLRSLPPSVHVSGRAGSDDSFNDVHLILEFNKGEAWAGLVAPRANRVILHSDTSNPLLESAEEFGAQLRDFGPHLLVVAGLQMMDTFPFMDGQRAARLAVVRQQMIDTAAEATVAEEETMTGGGGALVHLELASFSDLSLLEDLVEYIIPHAHSIGMNEQELPTLHAALVHGNVSLVADFNPRVATALDLMRKVFRILSSGDEGDTDVDGDSDNGEDDGGSSSKMDESESVGSSNKGRHKGKLSRLHLHTLGFQAFMVREGSRWRRTEAAAARAALTATRHVCGNQEISVAASTLLMDDGFRVSEAAGARRVMFHADSPVACWHERDLHAQVCVAPVLVCTEVKKTAGAGDNISAAALLIQL